MIGGHLPGKQFARVGAESARQGKELVERHALVSRLDVGEGGAAHVAVLRYSLLGETALAPQAPHGSSQFPVLRFDLLHLVIMTPRAYIVNHTDIP